MTLKRSSAGSPSLITVRPASRLTVATIVQSRESSVAESTLQTLSSRMAQAAQTPTILDGGAGRAAAAGRIAIDRVPNAVAANDADLAVRNQIGRLEIVDPLPE